MSTGQQSRLMTMAMSTLSAAMFLLAILAFLIVDIYHHTRRACSAVGDERSLSNYIIQLVSRRQPYEGVSHGGQARHDYYYTWQIGRMIRVHMEDATMVAIYILVFLAICVFLGIWLVQYWTIRWFIG